MLNKLFFLILKIRFMSMKHTSFRSNIDVILPATILAYRIV